MNRLFRDDVAIVIAGEAGQGIQSIESFLTRFLKKEKRRVFSSSEFMSRVRGGVNSTLVRVSSGPCSAFVDRIDVLIALNRESVAHLGRRVTKKTVVLGEKKTVDYEGLLDVPISEMAEASGGLLYSNSVAAGLICGLMRLDAGSLAESIMGSFSSKSAEIQEKNRDAALKGYEYAVKHLDQVRIDIPKDETLSCAMVWSGSDSVALGALAGGCDYVCAYPMSPSTGVLVNLAKYSAETDLIVEQVEDEIGVVNMALGAWYAGARALVTTSGGGFALMTEGVSLSGMIETPLVIHLAQRPGPATGLPTRTEQGDLNLALYAGHGEFPRAIFAPGDPEEGFHLTRRAFDVADRFQSPVFILTDQYFTDSNFCTPCMETGGEKPVRHIVKTGRDYRRYVLEPGGISPRGIPGHGEGLVRVDSDEHDESGFITEDLDLRVKMVDKRMAKMKLLKKTALKPVLTGNGKYQTLLVGWGSTAPIIAEAMKKLGKKNVAFLHFSQVFPLGGSALPLLKKARKIIAIENNPTGQFADLLEKEFGLKIARRILKYSGLQFSVEELVKKIGGILEE